MAFRTDIARVPVIDLSLFDLGDAWRDQVAHLIDSACCEFGYFQLVGHGIDIGLVDPLVEASRRFFAAEEAVQAQSGPDAASATATIAMRGEILLPELPGFREPVQDYMRSLTGLSHKLMAMIARGLLLKDSHFVDRFTGNPETAFRIDDCAPGAFDTRAGACQSERGLLAILKQDGMGGLEFKYQDRWMEVAEVPNSFVCAVGDTLARLTNGRYLAPAQQIRQSAAEHRLTLLFSFAPSEGAIVEPIAAIAPRAARVPFGASMPAGQAEAGRRQSA